MPTKQEALEALNTMSMGCGYDWDAFAPAEDTLRAYIESAEKDAERLDSGCIMTSDRDEWGEHKTQRRGLDLRAAIDAAITAAKESQDGN